RLGTERTRMGEVFVRRGLMPDGGGTWFLPRVIGLGKALELMLTGDLVGADEALRLGLLNRIVPSATCERECQAFADRLAAGPPLVHARVKAAVYAATATSLDAALDTELRASSSFCARRISWRACRPSSRSGSPSSKANSARERHRHADRQRSASGR